MSARREYMQALRKICHNEHPDAPKADWLRDDMMGATTWAYPKEAMTRDEFIQIIRAVRGSFKDAYVAYLEKTATFADPPEIGDQWPRDGVYALPSVEVFLQEFAAQASARSIEILLSAPEAEGQDDVSTHKRPRRYANVVGLEGGLCNRLTTRLHAGAISGE